jgi:hypothetical protein
VDELLEFCEQLFYVGRSCIAFTVQFWNSYHSILGTRKIGLDRDLFIYVYLYIICLNFSLGARGGAVSWGTALQAGRSRVQFLMVSLEFFTYITLPTALSPWVDSASNRNEYQAHFLGGKGGRCVGLTTLPPSCADCLEIWEPQPPGTLRTCPGLALPSPLISRYPV